MESDHQCEPREELFWWQKVHSHWTPSMKASTQVIKTSKIWFYQTSWLRLNYHRERPRNQKLRQQQQPLLAFHSHGWSVHHTRHNQKIPKIIFLPASTGWNHLLDVKWSTTLTCPFILAQKVHFVTKWQQDQHSFFSGDVFKVNVIGL